MHCKSCLLSNFSEVSCEMSLQFQPKLGTDCVYGNNVMWLICDIFNKQLKSCSGILSSVWKSLPTSQNCMCYTWYPNANLTLGTQKNALVYKFDFWTTVVLAPIIMAKSVALWLNLCGIWQRQLTFSIRSFSGSQ